MTKIAYVVSDDLVKVSSLLPSNPNRSLHVHALVKSLGLLRRTVILRPAPASPAVLAAYHSKDYIAHVLDPRNAEHTDLNAEYGLEDDCPLFRGVPQYVALVGASLAAAHALKNGDADVAICWDGGRHHARASGFCYVADVVLAILALKKPKPVPTLKASDGDDTRPSKNPRLTLDPSPSSSTPRSHAHRLPPRKKPQVMYIDLDLHFADGVAGAFTSDGRASQGLTLSLHHAASGFFPASPLAELPQFRAHTGSRGSEGDRAGSEDGESSEDEDAEESEGEGETDVMVSDPYTLSVPLRAGLSGATLKTVWVDVVERVRDAFFGREPRSGSANGAKDDASASEDASMGEEPSAVEGASAGGAGKHAHDGGRARAPKEVGADFDGGEKYVVIQCGVDGLAGDPCGVLALDIESMGWCIHRAIHIWRGYKVLLLGGGGYSTPNAARAWAYFTSIALGTPLDLTTPIPEHALWPAYAPSFALDTPRSHRKDENGAEYVEEVCSMYARVARVLERQRR